jgi:hypothetical protein
MKLRAASRLDSYRGSAFAESSSFVFVPGPVDRPERPEVMGE